MASNVKCTGWKVTKITAKYVAHDNSCQTSRKKKACRIAPAALAGNYEADTWTVFCGESKWNGKRGRWDVVPKKKEATVKTIFAARKIANQYLRWK